MQILLTNEEIRKEIEAYPEHDWIWIDIWTMSLNEIRIVVTVSKEEQCRLGGHKVFYICSAKLDEAGDVPKLKEYGRKVTRMLREYFPWSEVHSRLYYKYQE